MSVNANSVLATAVDIPVALKSHSSFSPVNSRHTAPSAGEAGGCIVYRAVTSNWVKLSPKLLMLTTVLLHLCLSPSTSESSIR